jgi:hypothetical protein
VDFEPLLFQTNILDYALKTKIGFYSPQYESTLAKEFVLLLLVITLAPFTLHGIPHQTCG